jgi:NitT/TauT family transport system substrate-binding protein
MISWLVRYCLWGLLCLTLLPSAQATDAPPFRLGLFISGTASWEVEALRQTSTQPFPLEVTPLATPQAGKIALLGGSVDAIIGDWLWAARARAEGDPVIFLPYSAAVGSLVVAPQAQIDRLSDLRGKRLGIAGGPLDKNWLILKAAAQAEGLDLNQEAEIQFAAPPLLSAQLERGSLDAVLTFWHFAAHLEAKGFTRFKSVEAMANDLLPSGSTPLKVPWLGYIVREDWAQAHPQALRRFYSAILQARHSMVASPELWTKVALTPKQSNDPTVIPFLRHSWQDGLPHPWTETERQRCAELFLLLRHLGGSALVGPAEQLDPALFWPVTLDRTGEAQWPAIP